MILSSGALAVTLPDDLRILPARLALPRWRSSVQLSLAGTPVVQTSTIAGGEIMTLESFQIGGSWVGAVTWATVQELLAIGDSPRDLVLTISHLSQTYDLIFDFQNEDAIAFSSLQNDRIPYQASDLFSISLRFVRLT